MAAGPALAAGACRTFRCANIGAGVTSRPRLVAALAGSADVEAPEILAGDLTVIFEGVLASA
jgi:hypothetical protein